MTVQLYIIIIFAATSIKSQVCEVVRVIRNSLYHIHSLFYCDNEDEETELKGLFASII